MPGVEVDIRSSYGKECVTRCRWDVTLVAPYIQTVAVPRDLLREACTTVCVGIIALGEIEPIRKSTLVSELCQTVLLLMHCGGSLGNALVTRLFLLLSHSPLCCIKRLTQQTIANGYGELLYTIRKGKTGFSPIAQCAEQFSFSLDLPDM